MSSKLTLADFLAPSRYAPVMLAVYNCLWRHAGQVISGETLGRAAWGDWGAEYSHTRAGQKAISATVAHIRERVAATKRPDAPTIQGVIHFGGYHFVCERPAIWGPMTSVKPLPKPRSIICKAGHVREFRGGEWMCLVCRREQQRARRQAQAVQL